MRGTQTDLGEGTLRRKRLVMLFCILALLVMLLAAPGSVTALEPGANQVGTPEPVPSAAAHRQTS